ncbi:MurR/RpiR family transcriptional regulator [Aliiroseovarius subalbicans]|uniref:MurR/RpiR family transcriptional regulator n=1 Tax=Aliiroseovarius subalbicans TaxID=2925840 RepID=UPI001F58292E|nr:MurR/RpiR family transcriptional regulator [Aliiroseovarius subalbicans]MCI2399654.1 MurR/RpiR family transcriptional regulator [Aliiroseovarius subalbicans]
MDPTLKSRLVASLKDEIAHLAPQLRTAAKYVIDHPSDFGLDSIRESARKAQVSTYTFVNIAKTMGFAGFEEFRQPFRHALVSGGFDAVAPAWLDDVATDTPLATTYVDAVKNTMSIVDRSLERQVIEELDAVADALTAADRVYLTAVRSSYAMAYYLHYVGRMALPSLHLIPRHMNSAIDDLNEAGPGDVLIAITITPYSRETIEACRFAKEKGVKLVLITDSEVVSPELAPEFSLVASVLSTHHFGCFSGMMAVIETLIALLMQRGGDAARARIKSYETLRKENNAYWVAQKKH